tara:strand:+ start:1104 stop:2486 length:1383 start_codon:yes stop_codon:yes gene_type:complete
MDNKLIAKLPKGWIDRRGSALARKKKIIKIIEDNFINFGFSALETPFAEISENIGSFLAADQNNPMSDVYSFQDGNERMTVLYDLSSPLARFFAENYRELPSVYKRYQIASVARNEKFDSKKIKLKSFMQADADIVGTVNKSQANSELINLIGDTLFKLGFESSQFKICISNRKIIEGLINDLKITNEKQKMSVYRAIDKMGNPNIAKSGVRDLLGEKRTDSSGAVQIGAQLSKTQTDEVMNFLEFKNLEEIKSNLKNPLSKEGILEMEKLLEIVSYGKYAKQIKLSLEKIRGLFYYDGWTVETELNLNNWKGISVCSGGEYSKLISRFKGVDTPGTGISFGVDRILAASSEINKIRVDEPKPVLVCVMEERFLSKYYKILEDLRSNGINSEIFLDPSKNMGKQLSYGSKRGNSIALICGENEFKDGTVTLKNLLAKKGENNQITIPKDNLIDEIKKIFK